MMFLIYEILSLFLLLFCLIFSVGFASFLSEPRNNLTLPRNLFRSVPNLGIGYSETHGIPRNEHFFPWNNENRSELIPGNFYGTEFRWQLGCPRKCVFDFRRNTEFFGKHTEFREIPRNSAVFFAVKLPRNSAEFRMYLHTEFRM
jgi:hypothetical protein